jgi:hypothetical protein
MLRANERIMPAMMPGRVSGNVITKSSSGVFQPAVDRLDRQADRAHHQREAHHGAGECRTGPTKRKDNPEMLVQELTKCAATAEEQQQDVACHHGRQDQWQMNQSVEQRFSPESPARQY